MSKVSIGDVTFRSKTTGKYVMLMGDPRIEALRKFYRREDLGDLQPFVFGPRGDITWDDVYWESAGPRVTGRGFSVDPVPGEPDRFKLNIGEGVEPLKVIDSKEQTDD